MSTYARRGLRVTVAAAGLAALGAGLAAPAFADTALPPVDGTAATPGSTATNDVSTTPDSPATPNLAGLSSLPTMNDLPQAFNFEAPQIATAAPATPQVPDTSSVVNTGAVPQAPQTDVAHNDATPDPSNVRAFADQASALQQLDSGMFSDAVAQASQAHGSDMLANQHL